MFSSGIIPLIAVATIFLRSNTGSKSASTSLTKALGTASTTISASATHASISVKTEIASGLKPTELK